MRQVHSLRNSAPEGRNFAKTQKINIDICKMVETCVYCRGSSIGRACGSYMRQNLKVAGSSPAFGSIPNESSFLLFFLTFLPSFDVHGAWQERVLKAQAKYFLHVLRERQIRTCEEDREQLVFALVFPRGQSQCSLRKHINQL